jgi:hypothetical protein
VLISHTSRVHCAQAVLGMRRVPTSSALQQREESYGISQEDRYSDGGDLHGLPSGLYCVACLLRSSLLGSRPVSTVLRLHLACGEAISSSWSGLVGKNLMSLMRESSRCVHLLDSLQALAGVRSSQNILLLLR